MINKIIKERRRSMNAAPTRPSNKSQWQGVQEDPNKNRKGHKAEHGQANHHPRTNNKKRIRYQKNTNK
jgi:hypothetical protein